MKIINSFLSVSLAFLLAACGGGGSSSGGGGGNNQFAGIYSGNVPVTFRFTGGVNDTSSDTLFVTMTVNGDGTFSIVDGINDPAAIRVNGTLNGNRFRASARGSDSRDGITCDLSLTYDGSIANNQATGTLTGNGSCSGLGTSANVSLNGNLSLPKRANSKSAIAGDSIIKSLMNNMQ